MQNLTKFLEIPNPSLYQWSSMVFTLSILADTPAASNRIGAKMALAMNIFNHTDLSTITNPRILKPKNASPFSTVQENGTKLQMQSHEIPHILTIAFIFTTNTMATEPSAEYISDADTIENTLNATCDISLAGINITNTDSSDQPHCIIYLMVVNECQSDEQYQLFAEFPMMGGHPPPPSYDFF